MSRDRAAFLDIVRAARRVLEFTAGLDRARFLKNYLVQSAILHQFMVMGEAVKRVSDETRAEHPEIPWKTIAGMRDKLIHDYNEVDLHQVWEAVTRQIPALLERLEPLAPKRPED